MSERTALFPCYADMKRVKLVDFHGWELPIAFGQGIVAEHHAVRNSAGVFDVSHMGRIIIEGPGSAEYVDRLFTSRIPPEGSTRCRYGFLCNTSGGCIDDILVYRLESERFMLVVNASNRKPVLEWLRKRNPYAGPGGAFPGIEVFDITVSTVQIAVQGPNSLGIVAKAIGTPVDDLSAIGNYRFRSNFGSIAADVVSRTGYTGEDGFEIYCRANEGRELWAALFAAGGDALSACGLGARDTLRFEAGMPLYGQELGLEITPVEAGLSSFIDFRKDSFCGREALFSMMSKGAPRRRIGLEMTEAAVPRSGNPVLQRGIPCGVVSSGGKCHTESFFGAMAIVAADASDIDSFEIEIHGQSKKARIRKLPFYRRK